MGSDQLSVQTVRVEAGSSEPSSHRFVAALNREVVWQGIDVIERLDDEQFTTPPAGLAHSGAGAHFRHIFDFYRCFLRDLDGGRIDYDRRDRDPLFEQSRHHAIACMRELAVELDAIAHGRTEFLPDSPLDARMDAVGDAGPDGHWNRTTFQRELRFLVSHTIHHYALIAVLLKVHGFDCGSGFGVAPSTVEHWKKAAV